jgi:Fe-S-cluster containining protein
MCSPKRKQKELADEEFFIKQQINNNGVESEYNYGVPAFDRLKEKIRDEFETIEGSALPIIMNFFQYINDLNELFREKSLCKSKCPECCSKHIAVSDLEIDLINNHIKEKKLKFVQIKPKKKLCEDEYCEDKYNEKYSGKECIFLENDICSIYSVRPFVCRIFIFLKNGDTKCAPINYIKENYINVGNIIKGAYCLIISGKERLQDISKSSLCQGFSDIRENFEKATFGRRVKCLISSLLPKQK